MMTAGRSREAISLSASSKAAQKIEKANRKYFSGARNSDHFREFLSYRLLKYRKTGA